MDRDFDIEGKRLCTHDKYFVVNYPCINQKNWMDQLWIEGNTWDTVRHNWE